jgi:hypothetical protein
MVAVRSSREMSPQPMARADACAKNYSALDYPTAVVMRSSRQPSDPAIASLIAAGQPAISRASFHRERAAM